MKYQINCIPNSNSKLLDKFCTENFDLLLRKGILKVIYLDVINDKDNSIIINDIEELPGKFKHSIALPIYISNKLYFAIRKWKPRLTLSDSNPYFTYLAYNKCRYGTASHYFPNSNTLYSANLIESDEGQELLKRIIELMPDRIADNFHISMGVNIEFDCLNAKDQVIDSYPILEKHLKEIPSIGKDERDEQLEATFKDYPFAENYLQIGLTNNYEHLIFRPQHCTNLDTVIESLKGLFKFFNDTMQCGIAINNDFYIHFQFHLGFMYEPPEDLLALLEYFMGFYSKESLYDQTGYGFEIILHSTKMAYKPEYLRLFLKAAKNIAENYLNRMAFEINNKNPTVAEYQRYCGFTKEDLHILNEFRKLKPDITNIIPNWTD